MYDYVDGKVDWMAFGLPVEGDDGPFLGDRVQPVATCDVSRSVADARRALDGSGEDVVVLVAEGMAVGEVDRGSLEGHAADVALLEILSPVPSTVRPSVTVASVAEGGGGARLVTSSDGRLLGRAAVEPGDAGHDGHDHDDHDDHEGHDHGGGLDMERYEEELTAVTKAVEERFGGREPSAEELRAFLHDRLVAEGKSAEDADRLLEALEVGEPD